MTRVRVAVVGGGIFGSTAAIRLAQRGHDVELFEKGKELLTAASGINQYRLHRGYHYPRSFDTAVSSRNGDPGFRAEYPEAVIDDFEHYFALSRRDSLVDADAYLAFLEAAELEYRKVSVPFVSDEAVQLCIRVRESLFDPAALRATVARKLRDHKVKVHLGVTATSARVADFDFVVVATYARLNSVLDELPWAQRNFQFEVCEKPVVRVPPSLQDKSIVIMDGPFMCLDPYGRTGLSVMGNVVHAIHHTNTGRSPIVPAELLPLLDAGVVPNPPHTRFREFIESGAEFIPDIVDVEHVGSMFTVRTVLPESDETDSRPTLVRRESDRVITLFSGKIGTCVRAAESVVSLVEKEEQPRATDQVGS